MRLHLMSWPEIETYLERSKGIIIPIGSTEQHGPNGLLGTDAICPEVIAWEAGRRGDILVGPTFNVGSAQHHLGFPGTITLRPSTLMAALQDWIASLQVHGFERILFFNGHGGNCATIEASFAESYANWSLAEEPCPYRLKTVNWWELNGVAEVIHRLIPVADGSHATASEVSVTYYAYPDYQKSVTMDPKIAPNGTIHDAAQYRASFPDGRIGSDPSQATPEIGKEIVDHAANALVTYARKFFST